MSLEERRPASRTGRPSLPTTHVSADNGSGLKAVATAERNSRAIAEALWALADENGCFCRTDAARHESRCSEARSALLISMETK